ncbi:hypothetical protein KK062_28360 [Fulvivirgaceae bacterium PWU5]|uniref:Uncharacterized protein n=1 Tax=Dawidia cretensis TaxID=2782350 RepID=A0AAP2E4N5_9BACT|nr:hypothetical protein [Dawidia cretensis]MBT1712188.1 hypothetical protein [Dawidia cretensis]
MRFIPVLIFTLIAGACSDKKQESLGLADQDSTRMIPGEPTVTNVKTKKPPAGLIISSDNIRIFGDTTIEKGKIYHSSIKFEPYISFQDFQTDSVDMGTAKATLDLSSKKGAGMFKTRIRNAYNADTVNFAGHYTFASWGCGSPCQQAVIVDRRTGKVYDAPGATRGYCFKPNSRMLIVNPPDSTGFYDDCIWCKPIIYLLDEATKEFMERSPTLNRPPR